MWGGRKLQIFGPIDVVLLLPKLTLLTLVMLRLSELEWVGTKIKWVGTKFQCWYRLVSEQLHENEFWLVSFACGGS